MTIPKDRLPNDSMLQNGMGYGPAMHLSQMKVSNQGLPAWPPGPKQPLALASMDLCNPVIVMDWLPPRHKGQATGPHSVRHLGRIGQLSTSTGEKKRTVFHGGLWCKPNQKFVNNAHCACEEMVPHSYLGELFQRKMWQGDLPQMNTLPYEMK